MFRLKDSFVRFAAVVYNEHLNRCRSLHYAILCNAEAADLDSPVVSATNASEPARFGDGFVFQSLCDLLRNRHLGFGIVLRQEVFKVFRFLDDEPQCARG